MVGLLIGLSPHHKSVAFVVRARWFLLVPGCLPLKWKEPLPLISSGWLRLVTAPECRKYQHESVVLNYSKCTAQQKPPHVSLAVLSVPLCCFRWFVARSCVLKSC